MDAYMQGFVIKCAQWNVDPVKLAQSNLSVNPVVPGSRSALAFLERINTGGRMPLGNYAKALAQAMKR